MISVFNKISPTFSTKLDLARAIAACLVALSHLRGGFFASYDHLTGVSHNPINYGLFFLTRLGHEAVIIFFVLSGYLVGGALLAEWMYGNPNWKKYLVNRVTRMWTVLIPALVLGALFDYYTLTFNMATPGAEHFTFGNFIGNIFFLQTIVVSTFGTNAPLWSLANEFWYYLLWPALFVILGYRFDKRIKGLVVLLFMAGCYALAPGIMKLFPIWMAGAFIRLVKDSPHFRNPLFIIFTYLLFLGSMGYANVFVGLPGEYVLCLSVCLVILGWQFAQESIIRPVFSRVAHFFSEFSFSLYAVHYFFMFLLFEVCKVYFGFSIRYTSAGIRQWGIFGCLVLITYLWAFVFYWFTERHTPRIRKAVLKRIESWKSTAL
jgi:peptidoglycan/LPS O-acetylase OafA/YrhL